MPSRPTVENRFQANVAKIVEIATKPSPTAEDREELDRLCEEQDRLREAYHR